MKRSLLILLVFAVIVGCGGEKKSNSTAANSKAVIDLNSANRLLALKRCPEAIAAYQQFLQNNPKDAGGWNMIGLAYVCDGKLPDAVSAFKQALAIAPTFTDVHNNLGVAYTEQKEYDLARQEFLHALEDTAYPKTGPYFNLARLAYTQQNYEESRALAKKVMTFSPKEAGPRLLYAMSLEQLGDLDDATLAYRDVLQQSPSNVEASYHLANILLKSNHPCEAKEYMKRVIDADPLSDLGQNAIQAIKTIQCTH